MSRQNSAAAGVRAGSNARGTKRYAILAVGMTTALIPVNRLDRAKGRLAAALDAPTRVALARATFTTVLAAAREAFAEVAVLTADAEAAEIALAGGATVIGEDEALSGLTPQLERAVALLGATEGGIAILHADLPLATGALLREFASIAPPAPSVTLVRSTDGGTNAMLLRPPGLFALAYGPGSYEKHVRAAEAAGMTITAFDRAELEMDLDTPDDLAAFLAWPAAGATAAGMALAERAGG